MREKPVCAKIFANFLLGSVQRDSGDVHAGSQHIPGFQLGELNSAADQRALLLVDTAGLLHLIHNSEQLLLGDGAVLLGVKEMGKQLFPLAKEKVERGQQYEKDPQDGRGKQGKRLWRLLGDALWGDFTEDQYHHGCHRSGHTGACFFAQGPDKDHSGKGRGGNIDNVVADQNRGEEAVIIF